MSPLRGFRYFFLLSAGSRLQLPAVTASLLSFGFVGNDKVVTRHFRASAIKLGRDPAYVEETAALPCAGAGRRG